MGPSLSAEERTQGSRQSEHLVEVGNGEQVLELGLGPQGLIQAATLRAVPVTAGVVAEVDPVATVTDLDVSAEAACATAEDVGRRLGLVGVQPQATDVIAEDVGDADSGSWAAGHAYVVVGFRLSRGLLTSVSQVLARCV